MTGTTADTATAGTTITTTGLPRNRNWSVLVESKRGNLAVPPFANLLSPLGSARNARMFHERQRTAKAV